jgi:hypothetical protein
MKKRYLYFFLPLLLVLSFAANSCKKESQTSLVESLLTSGQWQLASVMVFNYVGSTQLKTDTLNTTCTAKQIFQFTANHNCTYSNFACMTQNSSGNWSLSNDDLYLLANMNATDTVTGPNGLQTLTDRPFIYAQILNLGQYSLVLQTGDISTYYTNTTKRHIVQYGFVHPSAH